MFLVGHAATGNKYFFDLDIRKDLENPPPTIFKNIIPQFDCELKSSAEIPEEYGPPEQ